MSTRIDRLPRIQDALVGTTRQYPEQEIFLYPFADCVLLYFQQPCYLLMWIEGEDTPVFQTVAPCDVSWLDADLTPPWRRDERDDPHRFCYKDAGVTFHFVVRPMFSDLPVQPPEDLHGLKTLLFEPIRPTLTSAILARADSLAHGGLSSNEPTKQCPVGWETLLEPLRLRLDNCFASLFNSTPVYDQPNLWCAVRHKPVGSDTRPFRGHPFSYAASLLPTERQSSLIIEAGEKLGIADPMTVFRAPLSRENRAIADSVFESGCIDFGRPEERTHRFSREQYAPGNLNALRKKLEGAVYCQTYSRPGEGLQREPVIFYMPIHVAGTPWLALYSFWTGEPEEVWLECYWLRRDIMPAIAGRLRSAALEAYLDCIYDVLRELLPQSRPPDVLRAMINQRLSDLVSVYPFERVKLYATHVTDRSACPWRAECYPNDRFKRHIATVDVTETLVQSLIERAWVEVNALRIWQAFETYSVAHPLKNRLSVISSSFARIRELYGEEDISGRLAMHEQMTRQVYHFGQLIHLFHYVLVEGLERTFAARSEGKFRFATPDSLDLSRVLKECIDQCIPNGNSANYRIHVRDELPKGLLIRAYHVVPGTDLVLRLKDEFYVEALYEVLSNSLQHGRQEREGVMITIRVDEIATLDREKRPALVITNEVEEHRIVQKLPVPNEEWCAWENQGPTGLRFVSSTLTSTETGELLTRNWVLNESIRCFSVALILQGLSHVDLREEVGLG